MTIKGIVGEPLLFEFIGIGIATAVDAVKVMITFGTLYEIDIMVGGGGDCCCGTATYGTVVLAIHVIGRCGLFPDGGETLVIDGTNLIDTPQGTIGLCPPRIVMRGEEPLEMSANALTRCVCESLFCQTGLQVQ